MRWVALGLALLTFAACSGDEEERNAPPIGSGAGGPLGGGGASASATTGSATDGQTDGTDSASTGGTGVLPTTTASTGPDEFTVISGRFRSQGEGVPGQIQCRVLFHRPGQINPATGVATGSAFGRAFPIDAFPQSFAITSTEVGGAVERGETGFISAECDVDGDNFYDDQTGALFAGLPMQEVTVPVSSVDLLISNGGV